MLSLTFQKVGETIGSLCSGGPGLLIVGMLDGSIVPTFGSLDQFAAVLSAREQSQWLYYAAISTVGAMIGTFTTCMLGCKLGSAWLERKFGSKQWELVWETRPA